MNKRIISAVVVAVLTSTGIALATNQDGAIRDDMPPFHQQDREHAPKFDKSAHEGLPHKFNQLKLTDKQKAEIKKIMEANRPEKPSKDTQAQRREQFKQKMEQRRQQEQKLMMSKTFDEQAARQMIAQRQQERAAMEREQAERELQMLKTRHAVFQVLTAEQQKQYLENQKQHQQRRSQEREKRSK